MFPKQNFDEIINEMKLTPVEHRLDHTNEAKGAPIKIWNEIFELIQPAL